MRFFVHQGRALLLAAAVVVVAVCLSYGDNPPELVGQWVSLGGDKVELFKDGTGVADSKGITWKTEGKRFMLKEDGGNASVCDYNLSDYELTRTLDNGDVVVWVRKGKEEEYTKKKRKEAEQRFETISSYFTDSRNGQVYRSVKIGGKTWMAENLNYQTGNTWCYGNDNFKCGKYGRLYDWTTAKTSCPAGWHLPSSGEWDALKSAAGGGTAGKALKSTTGWINNGNGTDGYGFSALPGGFRFPNGVFDKVGNSGYWWTTAKGEDDRAYGRSMSKGDGVSESNSDKGFGHSVRCVADN